MTSCTPEQFDYLCQMCWERIVESGKGRLFPGEWGGEPSSRNSGGGLVRHALFFALACKTSGLRKDMLGDLLGMPDGAADPIPVGIRQHTCRDTAHHKKSRRGHTPYLRKVSESQRRAHRRADRPVPPDAPLRDRRAGRSRYSPVHPAGTGFWQCGSGARQGPNHIRQCANNHKHGRRGRPERLGAPGQGKASRIHHYSNSMPQSAHTLGRRSGLGKAESAPAARRRHAVYGIFGRGQGRSRRRGSEPAPPGRMRAGGARRGLPHTAQGRGTARPGRIAITASG